MDSYNLFSLTLCFLAAVFFHQSYGQGTLSCYECWFTPSKTTHDLDGFNPACEAPDPAATPPLTKKECTPGGTEVICEKRYYVIRAFNGTEEPAEEHKFLHRGCSTEPASRAGDKCPWSKENVGTPGNDTWMAMRSAVPLNPSYPKFSFDEASCICTGDLCNNQRGAELPRDDLTTTTTDGSPPETEQTTGSATSALIAYKSLAICYLLTILVNFSLLNAKVRK